MYIVFSLVVYVYISVYLCMSIYPNNNCQIIIIMWVCVPMVVEAYGAWDAEAMESLSCLASRLATSSNKAKAAVLNSLYGRLNLNIVKANATAMLSRCFALDM